MKFSTKNAAKPLRDVAYYRRRFQNRVFSKLVEFVNAEAQRDQITKKDLAERMGKDPGQVSRLLGAPSNLTLDSIADILLALDAEAEPPQIIPFRDRREANYMHPLMEQVLNAERKPVAAKPTAGNDFDLQVWPQPKGPISFTSVSSAGS